jgi:hypothetical protein
MKRHKSLAIAAAVFIAGQSMLPTIAFALGERAGVAAAVRGAVKQVSFKTPSAKIGRVVASGDNIHLGDRINTGAKAGLQIMLLDQTVFTIGPNASMVIDKFVYNPKTSKGSMQARILKGTFRFVSGKIAHKNPDGVKLKLKVATLSIRGTNVVGSTGGRSDVVVLSGTGSNNNGGAPASAVQISAGGIKITITESGWGAIVFDNGSGPQTQYFSAAAFQQILKALGVQPPPPPAGGTGTSSKTVTINTNIIISFTGQGTGAGIVNLQIGTQVFTFTTSSTPPTVLPPHLPPPTPPPSPPPMMEGYGEGEGEGEGCEVC